MNAAFPRIKPVGAAALLVELGDRIDAKVNARVIALDQVVTAAAPKGLAETVPAYASLLLTFDPLITDGAALTAEVLHLARSLPAAAESEHEHVVPVCYDGPDLAAVAKRAGLTIEQVIGMHRSADYRCYMYGFAPGYAYLGGVPEALRLPRKASAERGHPVGSVIVAGAQCLITTLPMPTGWWVIGRTSLRVLDPMGEHPFRFNPGDRIRFEQVDRVAG